MAGKGSKRRKGSNDQKYREGWDTIFGGEPTKKKKKKETEEKD